MEGRKLQLTGGSTYVVSLPKRWVLDAGLKAGDTVFLETEGDGAVSVRPRPADKVPMRRRLFEEKGEERRDHLLRKLIGAYIGGFSFIEIRFPSEMAPFVRKVAREFSHMVIGPEVIEESRNALIIQDLSDTAELSAEKCLRRMHLIVRAMDAARESAMAILDKAFNALLTADVDAANEAVDDLARHQKLIDGLSHHVATRKGEELLALAAIVDSLGRTANYATDIAEIAIDHAVYLGT